MAKTAKEIWKTRGQVFDQFTLRTLFKLGTTFGFSEEISPIKIGKEANVFLAETNERKLAIKIYRLETCDFNRMYDYIKFDPRYAWLKNNTRKTIFAWTQREYRNLQKAHDAGVTVPQPFDFAGNILIMEYIGDGEPAPQLKDATPDDPEAFYRKTIAELRKLYSAGLVHGDLSSFNILNLDEEPVLIDFSQASPLTSNQAQELLERDARNLATYFSKTGVRTGSDTIIAAVKAPEGKKE